MSKKTIILIPARLAATRLPNKPLLKIHGRAMLLHVYERAVKANVGPVWVCAGDQEIMDAVLATGGNAVLTPADLPSGTDRIYDGLQKIPNAQEFDLMINLQADLPNIKPELITQLHAALTQHDHADMVTPMVKKLDAKQKQNPNVVKAIGYFPVKHYQGKKNSQLKPELVKLYYFTRAAAPYGTDEWLHHIGIYGFQKHALSRFVQLPPSPLELIEKLEQLRAIENGIKVYGFLTNHAPQSVDTAEDLVKAIELMQP